MRNLIATFYFAFTTLTTVGLGDLRPYSNYERIFNAIILFTGVSTFSYIIGNFLDVIHANDLITAENEDADNLSRFFGILEKYNYGRKVKKEFTTKVEDFFEFYWTNDHRYCISDAKDMRLLDELPSNIQTSIF